MSDGGSLSQEQIDALLKGDAPDSAATPVEMAAAPETPQEAPPSAPSVDFDGLLSFDERDTLGEIGNICMASAATTLSTLLGNQVVITTPNVTLTTEHELVRQYHRPAALISIDYTEGLDGTNVFVLSTQDASVVADLMMGGAGAISNDLSPIHTSAVGEAMNQMMGAAATAMADMLGRRVDISAPQVTLIDLTDEAALIGLTPTGDEPLVSAAFELRVGGLLTTTLVQLMPVEFARSLVDALTTRAAGAPEPAIDPEVVIAPEAISGSASTGTGVPHVQAVEPPLAAPAPRAPEPALAQVAATLAPPATFATRSDAVAQPVSFPPLGEGGGHGVPGDISLLLDVPLQISVELGRTELRIRNVLELVPGSIIELDRLAGEPVDVLVNGKAIARGEVVVIDEEFGVRITEIASQASRLRNLAEV
jgi:flagellar motor switch protein FliN